MMMMMTSTRLLTSTQLCNYWTSMQHQFLVRLVGVSGAGLLSVTWRV